MFERFCIPQDATLINKLGETFSGLNMESILEGIGNAKWMIFSSILLAFISSFLFSFFLETCAGVVITITIIGFYAGLGFLTFVCWTKKGYHQAIYDKDNTESVALKLAKFFKISFYICASLLTVSLCLLVCFLSRIVIAIKVIKVRLPFPNFFITHFFRLQLISSQTSKESSSCRLLLPLFSYSI